MSFLVVLLPLQPVTASTEFDYVFSRDSRTVGTHSSALAALLPQPAGAGAEVVAIAPAGAVSWHQVELPKGTSAGSPRLRAILEGVLEDRLLDEPEALHFAVQPQLRSGAPVWVAVCDRAWLRGAVAALEAARRPATRIVPEFAPDSELALYALGDPENAVLVAAGGGGVMSLPLASASLALLAARPDETPCIAEPAVAELAEQVLQHGVVLQQAPQRWLEAAESAWDLAQFDLSSSSRARTYKKIAGGWSHLLSAPQWRPARWAAALFVAINLIGLNAWAWVERAALEGKRQIIGRTLTQTFPQVKVVVDAPLQMEKEVAALRQATGATSGRDLEAMLAALSTVAGPARVVSGLDFTGAELRARGLALSPQEAPAIASGLKSQGYVSVLQGDTLVLTQDLAR